MRKGRKAAYPTTKTVRQTMMRMARKEPLKRLSLYISQTDKLFNNECFHWQSVERPHRSLQSVGGKGKTV